MTKFDPYDNSFSKMSTKPSQRATIEFDMDDDEQRRAMMRYLKSIELALVLHKFSQAKKEFEARYDEEAVDAVYERFFSIMDSYGINLEDLIQ